MYLLNNGCCSDFQVSLFYVLLSISSFFTCWYCSDRKLNLFFLFLITFNLFIGGRFYVYLFDDSVTPFLSTFFFAYKVSSKDVLDLMNYVFCFLYFITLGHYIAMTFPVKEIVHIDNKYINADSINIIARKALPIITICLLYLAAKSSISSLKNGYAFVEYNVSNVEYNISLIEKIAPMLLSILLSLSFVYTKEIGKKYLNIYAVWGVCVLLGGSRAAFGSVLLLWIWLYSMEHRVSLIRLGVKAFSGLVILLLIFSLSSRGDGLDSFSFWGGIKLFLYTNGGSLMIFDASKLIENYPLVGYFQTFIPGVTYIYSLISETPIYPQDATFSYRMCYELNPKLFADGMGLGWTTLSDLYVYSQGNIIFFSMFSVLLGNMIGCLENWSKKSSFYKYVTIAVTPGVLMMSRGMLSAFFVQIIYAIVWYAIFACVSKYILNKRMSTY